MIAGLKNAGWFDRIQVEQDITLDQLSIDRTFAFLIIATEVFQKMDVEGIDSILVTLSPEVLRFKADGLCASPDSISEGMIEVAAREFGGVHRWAAGQLEVPIVPSPMNT